MRVLVTGGAGFIGSSVVHVLKRAGHEVGVIDDLSTGTIENIDPDGWFRRLDILDAMLGSAMAEFAPDAVVHLAAQASVSVSLKNPERDWVVNAEGTRRVAIAAAEAGVARVLSASSAAVYGDPETVPLVEDARIDPMNPYGRSKRAAELMLDEVLAQSAVDFASLRFANVYGPRQDAAGEGGVVALFLDAIARGREPVIYGDGRQTRDFIYVADIASAVLAALESEVRLCRGGSASTQRVSSVASAYNISTGIETSVRALADHVRVATHYAGAFDRAPAREGDIVRSALDPGKARTVIGWQAQVPLERGLAATWRWFANRQ